MTLGRAVRPSKLPLLALMTVLGLLVGLAASTAPSHGQVRSRPALQLVRTVWTNDLRAPDGSVPGMRNPSGITFDSARDQLLVLGPRGNETAVFRMGFDEDLEGLYSLGNQSSPGTVTYDPNADEVLFLHNDEQVRLRGSDQSRPRPQTSRRNVGALRLNSPRSAAFDGRANRWLVLEADGQIARSAPEGSSPPERIRLRGVGNPRALAVHPSDGRLYVLGANGTTLFEVAPDGSVQSSFDLTDARLRDPRGMTFAPTSDATDDPTNLNLFVVDAGSGRTLGGVAEISMDLSRASTPSLRMAQVEAGTLKRTIQTSDWSPAAPDPAGVTWLPTPGELLVVDSEVDEQTGAGWHDVNLWRSTLTGAVTGTGTLWGPNAATWNRRVGFSKEPTGASYDPASDTLFISDDDHRGVFVIKRGSDGAFGTSDDVVSKVDAGALGSTDTEDPEFDPTTGHLFFLDGVGMEVYRIDPVDGVFGNGNDIATQFDISHLGPKDFEGLAIDPERGTLYVGARNQYVIFEITKTGQLIREIDVSGIAELTFISGLGIAPASDGSGANRLWISDRAIDNGYDPNENDGRLFEVAASGIGTPSTPPTTTTTTTTTQPTTTTTQPTTTTTQPTTTTTQPTTTTTQPTTTTTTTQPPAGAMPVFVGAASATRTSASGTALVVPRPSGVQPGHVMVAHVRHRGTTLTAPSGWTELGEIPQSVATHTLLYKVAGANEPSTYAFDHGVNAGRMAGGIVAYSGVDPAAPIHAWAPSVPDTPTLAAPSVTTSVGNTVVLRLWGWRSPAATEPGVGFNLPPSGVTQRWSEQEGHVNFDRNRVLGGSQQQVAAGPVGTSVASGSSSSEENRRSAFTVVLAPAP